MTLVRIALLAVLLIPGLAREAAAIDATTWRTLSPDSRRGYVNGVVDTWINFQKGYDYVASQKVGKPAQMSASESLFLNVSRCIVQRKLNYNQINAAVEKYVETRADRRQHGMASVTWNAVTEMCKK